MMKLINKSTLPVIIIAIDGHGGSGKSTLANLLAKKYKAEIIHTDDFASWDNPTNWWPLVITYVFEPIKNQAKILNYPRSKWGDLHNPRAVFNQEVTKIMILEGVSTLRKEFREYVSYGIFVDTPKAVCLKRGFDRDKSADGKNDREVMEMWENWYREEEEYFRRDDPKNYADLIIKGEETLEEQIKA